MRKRQGSECEDCGRRNRQEDCPSCDQDREETSHFYFQSTVTRRR